MKNRALKKDVTLFKIKKISGYKTLPEDKDIIIKHICSYPTNNIDSMSFSSSMINSVKSSGYTFAPIGSINNMLNILVENPRYDFAKVLIWLEEHIGFKSIFQNNIHEDASISTNAVIGEYVQIGSGTIVEPGVIIYDNVSIGSNCVIKANAVIGNSGFGVAQHSGDLIKIPHIGGVQIEECVEIGSLSTINRGTLGLTKICSGTKIDDHVHIAHNCRIGPNNIITAGVTIGGSVFTEDSVWLGLGASVHQKVRIGSNAVIGLGSNVFVDVISNTTVAGYPAKRIPKLT